MYDFSSIKAFFSSFFFFFLLFSNRVWCWLLNAALVQNVLTTGKPGAYSPFHKKFRRKKIKEKKIVSVLDNLSEQIDSSQITRKVEKEKKDRDRK